MEQLVFLVLVFGVFYLLLVRPQQQRVKAQRALIESLVPGEEVITAGGILGRVTSLEGDVVMLETTPGVLLRVRRGAIAARTSPPVTPDVADDGS